jgi:Na+-transporting methylmalonyl-CoA/oxaloacetate decarboxylase gamma subunit
MPEATSWGIVAEMWGGFGITILVLVILCLVAWLVGLVLQKTRAKSKETPAKDKQ